jgi:ribosomal protein L13E
VWPTDTVLPGPVKRGSRVPDVDRRRARRDRSSTPVPAPVVTMRRQITTEAPADVRVRVAAGATLAELAAEYGAPWQTVRRWVNGARS